MKVKKTFGSGRDLTHLYSQSSSSVKLGSFSFPLIMHSVVQVQH